MLNTANVKNSYQLSKNSWNNDFNCWGTTLYILNELPYLSWVDEFDMQEFLDKKTKPVTDNLQKGDILVLYNTNVTKGNRDHLAHTAVYVGGGRWFHKRGPQDSRFSTKKEVILDYRIYSNHAVIVRMK